MGKQAARRSTTTESNDPTSDYFQAFNAKSQLISGSIGLGWQLALTVLIPLFVGVQVDKHFDTSPSYTLTALFIAVAGSVVIISRTFKDITREQAAALKKSGAKKKKETNDA